MSEGLAWTLGVLSTWRLTHLLWAEDGPGGVLQWLRLRATRVGLQALFDCFYCLSLWVALPVAALLLQVQVQVQEQWGAVLHPLAPLAWLGLSGAAILLERLTTLHRPADSSKPEEPS